MTIIVFRLCGVLHTEFPENDDACEVRVDMLLRKLLTRCTVIRSRMPCRAPKTGLN